MSMNGIKEDTLRMSLRHAFNHFHLYQEIAIHSGHYMYERYTPCYSKT